MLIRVRTNVGIWRVDGLDPATSTPRSVLEGVARTRPDVVYTEPLCSDPACEAPLDGDKSLEEQGLGHGSMVHCRVDPETCADGTAGRSAAAAAGAGAGAGAGESKDGSEGGGGGAAAGGGGSDSHPVDPWSDESALSNMRRVIGKDGTIKLVPSEGRGAPPSSDRGFRRGMLPLRDMKMAWTLNEFVEMDSRYVFKVQRQGESWVGGGGVSLDTECADDFQSYMRRFDFGRNRFGFLYGRFVDDDDEDGEEAKGKGKDKDKGAKGKDGGGRRGGDGSADPPKNRGVVVEAIYEPPQESDPSAAEGFVALDDPTEGTVDGLASMLGLSRVGWIFGHPPREEGFHLSAAEVIMAAELQLEAADGVNATPFVTVKVTVGEDGNASFEAFQVSMQCMEMVAEQALEVGPNPGQCYVNETFTAIQEGKESRTVENNFFLTVVPIVQHKSETFVSHFPRPNRHHDDRTQSHEEMRRQLSKAGGSGWTFVDLLSDFNLLLYLCKFLDVGTDMPKICESVVDRSVPLDDGYKIIIAGMAGMDGSY